MPARPITALFILQIFVLAYCAINAMPALAHSRLLASQPEHGAKLAEAPVALVLLFSSPPVPGYARIELARNHQWQPLQFVLNETRAKATLPRLGSGHHKVRWSVISRDGHRQYGTIEFFIR
jgi:methionine-rich copper-binding protein CopC